MQTTSTRYRNSRPSKRHPPSKTNRQTQASIPPSTSASTSALPKRSPPSHPKTPTSPTPKSMQPSTRPPSTTHPKTSPPSPKQPSTPSPPLPRSPCAPTLQGRQAPPRRNQRRPHGSTASAPLAIPPHCPS